MNPSVNQLCVVCVNVPLFLKLLCCVCEFCWLVCVNVCVCGLDDNAGIVASRPVGRLKLVSTFLFHGRRRFGQPLDFQSVGGAQKRGQLLLRHVHLAGVHELENCLQMAVRDVLQDDDRMLGRVFLVEYRFMMGVRMRNFSREARLTYLEQRLEVRTAGG